MGNHITKLKEKTRSKLYDIGRKIYLKNSICNIGEVVEEEDKIVCYVTKEALTKYRKGNPIYKLPLTGISDVTEKDKEIAKNLNLTKPFYYIFENIEFKSSLHFASICAHVIFKNCTFHHSIRIAFADDVTFENNEYEDHCSFYCAENCFFTARAVKKLTFLNDVFANSDFLKMKEYYKPNFSMNITSDLLEFINTNLDYEDTRTVQIKSKQVTMSNSDIAADEIYIDSKNIAFSDSTITAKNGVIIENENMDFNGDIQAPIILYNGVDLADKIGQAHSVNEEEKELKAARVSLAKSLRSLSERCQQANDDKIKLIRNGLDNQPVTKVLKR